ncbi:MAG: primosomal protein N' [Candidatus Nanogingivalaceae bacterium]|nr:primosomal protein N' [Candidatus Nanogingivalaceae bacterium]
MHYYLIAPAKIIKADAYTFTYHSHQSLAIGAIVVVSAGKQSLVGIVVDETTKPEFATKEITTVLDLPQLPRPLLQTSQWMSNYYITHLALVLQTILPSGLTKKRRALTSSNSGAARNRTHFLLNKDQLAAVDTLSNTKSGTAILHGVTSSGKTAVYIEYAKKLIAAGKSVIVIVPEIALTTQLIAEFQQSFPGLITTHSQQTEAQRHHAWLQALNANQPNIAIGPRSALFMPFRNIGAIIIDEAHEPALKQDQTPRYSTLRTAAILAKYHRAIVIQGSATPLVSEYYLATKTNRPIINLPARANPNIIAPSINVVDMTSKIAFLHHRFLSDLLLRTVSQNLENNKQTLIYHNRRGTASTTLCQNCGWSALCPRCFTPLTLHADKHALICHICGRREHVPTTCPDCGSTDIIHKGIGTKLIENELSKLFPQATIARFDGDITNKNRLDQRYQELYDGRIDIIIGTQVVAKGLDLPHLAAVGIIQADAGLALPDFTTRERTFQLLAQVIGRVGRNNQPTSVVVQTYQPQNPTIVQGIRQDYASFYADELAERRRSGFPPFVYLLKLTCIYKTEATAIRNSQKFAAQLRSEYPDITIFGPIPAFYERLRDTYRWQIIVKSTNRAKLLDIICKLPSGHWQYDIDPANLL